MKNILVFAGSNSSNSINHMLLEFLVKSIASQQVQLIKLTDFALPMYSEDLEREAGFGSNVHALLHEIKSADALIISVNEHNGTVSAYFKNTLDWLSRLDRNFLKDKKILLVSTSRGKRGAASALEYTKGVLPRFGGEVVDSFSLPNFDENFSVSKQRMVNETLYLGMLDVVQNFSHQIEL
ncbi:MAG: NADPH-dependent FMN reductase [Flavobacteriaceae bacterium]|nr:NADPH-dependent FMN reductase [Flavobacteriaceae bacterium]